MKHDLRRTRASKRRQIQNQKREKQKRKQGRKQQQQLGVEATGAGTKRRRRRSGSGAGSEVKELKQEAKEETKEEAKEELRDLERPKRRQRRGVVRGSKNSEGLWEPIDMTTDKLAKIKILHEHLNCPKLFDQFICFLHEVFPVEMGHGFIEVGSGGILAAAQAILQEGSDSCTAIFDEQPDVFHKIASKYNLKAWPTVVRSQLSDARLIPSESSLIVFPGWASLGSQHDCRIEAERLIDLALRAGVKFAVSVQDAQLMNEHVHDRFVQRILRKCKNIKLALLKRDEKDYGRRHGGNQVIYLKDLPAVFEEPEQGNMEEEKSNLKMFLEDCIGNKIDETKMQDLVKRIGSSTIFLQDTIDALGLSGFVKMIGADTSRTKCIKKKLKDLHSRKDSK